MNKYAYFIYTMLWINDNKLFTMTDCINKVVVLTSKGGRIEMDKDYPFDSRITGGTGDLTDIVFHI